MSDRTDIRLRPVTDADEAFLNAVYASTRTEELALSGWPEEIKTAFCQQQARAQHAHYRQHYPTAEYLVIEHAGTPVGRLYIDRWPREIRIMDITVLPEHRGHGIGTHLLHAIITEGTSTGKPVSIHVERVNPALRLYERLGFRLVEDKGLYLLMECAPTGAT